MILDCGVLLMNWRAFTIVFIALAILQILLADGILAEEKEDTEAVGRSQTGKKDIKTLAMLSQQKPDSDTAEAFRNIKIALTFAKEGDTPPHAMVVTSSEHREGKTFAACNLATIFAHANQPTLLIDGDMRKGVIGDVFGAKDKKGLSDVLSGNSSLDEAIISTDIPNLSLMPAGTLVHNPTDLLETGAFSKMFQECKAKFQRVIVDVPSLLHFADCFFWEHECDGLVLVIKSGSTPLAAINESKKKLSGKIQTVGAVLNDAEVKKDVGYYIHYFRSSIKPKT